MLNIVQEVSTWPGVEGKSDDVRGYLEWKKKKIASAQLSWWCRASSDEAYERGMKRDETMPTVDAAAATRSEYLVLCTSHRCSFKYL
jgi:hypothetical protein